MNSAETKIESDAFVFFGATGDLAYKKIFPALYAMVQRGGFHIPIIGMARAGWNLDKLVERARDSVISNNVCRFDSSGSSPPPVSSIAQVRSRLPIFTD